MTIINKNVELFQLHQDKRPHDDHLKLIRKGKMDSIELDDKLQQSIKIKKYKHTHLRTLKKFIC